MEGVSPWRSPSALSHTHADPDAGTARRHPLGRSSRSGVAALVWQTRGAGHVARAMVQHLRTAPEQLHKRLTLGVAGGRLLRLFLFRLLDFFFATVVSLCHNNTFHLPERGVRRGYSPLNLHRK